ncbi:ABC transporter ATP-binding protein [Crocosphaera chwakensis]|uniref:HlyB/MsbA family ABC transporter n=1 Tax=Crocosphaera chwakensis CCY0110 TaxID=391612 RepID=A3INP2_9CHRO|nr:ABC transporter ATP-binding protein [Crocosphaera chwakensis]EAZ91940.1 HlyB/MsbA family ABC transporter [Crocosphaera chwakensis CCY0110]
MNKTKTPPAIYGHRKWLLIRLIINGFAQTLATLANAAIVEMTFDRLIVESPSDSFGQFILPIILALLAAIGAIAWLRMTERIDAESLGQEYADEIRLTLYRQLSRLNPRTLQNRSQGAVSLRFVGDLNAMRQWVSLGLARLTVTTTITLGVVLVLTFISWPLGLSVTGVLTIGFYVSLNCGQQLQMRAKEARRYLSRLAGNINEKVAAIAVVQVFGQSHREEKRIARQSLQLKEARIERAKVAGQLQGVMEATASLASAVALFVGAIEVSAGRTTPGTVVAVMSLVGLLVPRLREVGRVQEYWHNFQVSYNKIEEFLKIPSLITEKPHAPHLNLRKGHLAFESVGVADVLFDITVEAKPSQVVALVGPNGAGKSTLLGLAARLFDPDSGTIRLDGQNLANYSLSSVRQAIAMAGPDLPLLRGSIKRNLLYRCPDASPEEINQVWQLCGIHELLAELPQGEDTKISEGGKGLSSGQRQRIALARAILGNPAVLLLDEIDANLDVKSSAIVDRVINHYSGTVLLITHRPERLANVDVIWYLENGRLLEAGESKKMLQNYSVTRLFNSQKLLTTLS